MLLNIKTNKEILDDLAMRVRERRLEKNLTQKGLATRAGMPLATYRHFELTGEVSVQNLLRIAFALGVEDDFDQLFAKKGYSSIEELTGKTPKRQRGRKS